MYDRKYYSSNMIFNLYVSMNGEKSRPHNNSISMVTVLSLRDSYFETMSLFFVLGDTEPPSSLDRGVINHVCPCLCSSTAAIKFFTLSPSVEPGCTVTLAGSKSVQPVPWWRELRGQMVGLMIGSCFVSDRSR